LEAEPVPPKRVGRWVTVVGNDLRIRHLRKEAFERFVASENMLYAVRDQALRLRESETSALLLAPVNFGTSSAM